MRSRVCWEEAFIRYGVAYRLVAGTRFYERREVKDVIAYFRMVQNPQDSVSLQRIINVPGRGIGTNDGGEIIRLGAVAGDFDLRRAADAGRFETEPELRRGTSDGKSVEGRAGDTLARFSEMMAGFVEKSQNTNLVELFDFVVESSNYKQFTLERPRRRGTVG